MLYYEKEITITPEFLDQNDHVNNVQYVKWVEMIATEHWDSLKSKSRYQDCIWFLVNHCISYKKQAFLNDVLRIRTFPVKMDGIRQPRKVEFYKDNHLLVESETQWIMIDPITQKIIRPNLDWLDELKS